MANIPIYSAEEIRDRKVTDVDMSLVFNMPFIERTIFQYALRDDLLKEIINYEKVTKEISHYGRIHPKHGLPEARALLVGFAKKIKFEPICNNAFNEARECLFRSKMHLRFCKSQLENFEECYHDPLAYSMFEEAGTVTQLTAADYFSPVYRGDFSH